MTHKFATILWHMADPLRVSLTYKGPAVDKGEMDVDDVVSALQGFTGAYDKLAAGSSATHRLRVSGIKQSSFDIEILAYVLLADTANQQEIVKITLEAAKRIVSEIAQLIRVKRHIKNKPYKIDVRGDNNTVVVISNENSTIETTRSVAELLERGTINRDLAKIASPLRKGEIDVAQLTAADETESISAEIPEEERESFEVTERTVAVKSEGIDLEGKLFSLNNENNTGGFRLKGGDSIRYRYVGDDPSGFHQLFGRDSLVRVRCDASLDEDLKPIRLEIHSAEALQRLLPMYGEDSDDQ